MTAATATSSSSPPSSILAVSSGNNNDKTTPNTSNTSSSFVDDEQQLSHDLAQFLSNPSLQQALADGSLDLTSYSEQVQDELQALEQECIHVYRDKALVDIPTLRYELEACDGVLRNLQEMLLGLQADVSGVSGDLRQLQETSRTLSIQLQNRTRAQDGLQQYLQHVVMAPSLVYTLCRGPVPSLSLFGQAVTELQHLVQYTHDASSCPEWSCHTPPAHTAAAYDQRQRIDTLVQVAVVRIRDYLLSQLLHLQQHPQTNVRMLQVHGLLKYTMYQEFLQQAAPHIAQEIFHLYIETMSKTLYALFRTYQAQLLQLDSTKQNATRLDVIAIEDAVLRDAVTTKAKKRFDSLALSNRLRVLEQATVVMPTSATTTTTSTTTNTTGTPVPHGGQQQQQPMSNNSASSQSSLSKGQYQSHQTNISSNNNINHQTNSYNNNNMSNPVILAHVALAEHSKYPYEMLFRSLLQHLLDAVTNEHVVCRQFFHRDAFSKLFPPTLSLLSEQLENYLFSCHDAICLLLLIKVTHQYQRMARARRITSLDPWYDHVTKLIWPRLKMVMDAHLRSLQHATAAKLGGVDLHAHYVSRRFAEFTCSILLILVHNHHPQQYQQQQQQQQQQQYQQQQQQHNSMNTSNDSKTGSHAPIVTRASSSSVGAAPTPPLGNISRRSNSDAQPFASPLPMATTTTTTTTTTTPNTTTTNNSTPSRSNNLSANNSIHNNSAGDRLLQDLATLQDEFILLLERLAESHTTSKQRVVFMINNLDQIVCLFQERRVVGKELNRFIELLMAQRELFVEEELLQSFSKMIAFVQQTESHLRSAAAAGLMSRSNSIGSSGSGSANSQHQHQHNHLEQLVNAQVVEALVRDFSSNWKSGMEQINKNVLSYFSNFRNGMEILKQVLTQLLLYYTRFQDIIRKVWRNNNNNNNNKSPPPAFCKDLVSTGTILTEIKKYALAI